MSDKNKNNTLSQWVLIRVGINTAIPLKFGKSIVGRLKGSDIIMKSNFCSKRHCEINVRKKRVILTDFSSNGVFVNATHYHHTKKVLANGDRIGFGAEARNDECSDRRYHVYYLRKIRRINSSSSDSNTEDEDKEEENFIKSNNDELSNQSNNNLNVEDSSIKNNNNTHYKEYENNNDFVVISSDEEDKVENNIKNQLKNKSSIKSLKNKEQNNEEVTLKKNIKSDDKNENNKKEICKIENNINSNENQKNVVKHKNTEFDNKSVSNEKNLRKNIDTSKKDTNIEKILNCSSRRSSVNSSTHINENVQPIAGPSGYKKPIQTTNDNNTSNCKVIRNNNNLHKQNEKEEINENSSSKSPNQNLEENINKQINIETSSYKKQISITNNEKNVKDPVCKGQVDFVKNNNQTLTEKLTNVQTIKKEDDIKTEVVKENNKNSNTTKTIDTKNQSRNQSISSPTDIYEISDDEENIEIQFSQSCLREIKKEVIDFECENVPIVIDDDDDDDNNVENDIFMKIENDELECQKNQELHVENNVESAVENRRPFRRNSIFDEKIREAGDEEDKDSGDDDDDDDDDDDAKVYKWAKILSQSQNSSLLLHEDNFDQNIHHENKSKQKDDHPDQNDHREEQEDDHPDRNDHREEQEDDHEIKSREKESHPGQNDHREKQEDDHEIKSREKEGHPGQNDHHEQKEDDNPDQIINYENKPLQKDHFNLNKEKYKQQRKLPEIILPPSLPTKKGRLRGVSAVIAAENVLKGGIENQKLKLKIAEQKLELKRKFKQKPSVEVRNEKTKKQIFNEKRRQKLKEIAEEQTVKRKLSENNDDDVKILKKPKVKVTHKNRGAFLTKPLPQPSTSSASFENTLQELDNRIKTPQTTKHNSSIVAKRNNFARRNSVHEIKHQQQNMSKKIKNIERRYSIQDSKHSNSSSLTKSSLASNNQLNQNNSSHGNNNSAENLPQTSNSSITCQPSNIFKRSNLKSPNSTRSKQNLRVRFDKNTYVKYFEIEKRSNTETKINPKMKDAPTPTAISKFLQHNYKMPLIDHSEKILKEILTWKPIWLQTHKHGIVVPNPLLPIVHQFSSFDQFTNILLPLMKLELWASMEQDFMNHEKLLFHTLNRSNSDVEQIGQILTVEYSYISSNKNSSLPFNVGDLCIATIGESYPVKQYFTYISSVRKQYFHNSSYEIILKFSNDPILCKLLGDNTKELKIKSITQIRVELGAFNAIYSLEHSLLLKNILNPLENAKIKINDNLIKKIRYKGCHELNENQEEILLKTYLRSIDNNNPTISLIEGPPGTGKSLLITNLTLQLLYGSEVGVLRKKILICSQSNAAIDVICCKLIDIRKKMQRDKFGVVRFGILERMHSKVKCVSVQLLVKSHLKQQMENKSGDNSLLKNEKLLIEAKIADLEQLKMRDSVNFDELQDLKKQLERLDRIENNHVNFEDEKNLYAKFINGANIVCTTLCSAIKLLQYTKHFDVCIIDEATQCTEHLSLIPLQFSITSLILVGDTQQLPATVLSKEAKNCNLGRSLFTRIQSHLKLNNINNNDCVLKLTEQYRMHSEISHWPNIYFYNGELKNNVICHEKIIENPYMIINLNFKQNSNDKNGKISNTLEAKFILDIILQLSKTLPIKQYQYGVITPYAEHRDILSKIIQKAGLYEIAVNTIDSYQGKEKDVIIISNARTKGIGFLAHPQRLNVALTRARKALYVCGNFSNVEKIPVWKSLLEDAKKRKVYLEVSDDDANDVENKVFCHIIKK